MFCIDITSKSAPDVHVINSAPLWYIVSSASNVCLFSPFFSQLHLTLTSKSRAFFFFFLLTDVRQFYKLIGTQVNTGYNLFLNLFIFFKKKKYPFS